MSVVDLDGQNRSRRANHPNRHCLMGQMGFAVEGFSGNSRNIFRGERVLKFFEGETRERRTNVSTILQRKLLTSLIQSIKNI